MVNARFIRLWGAFVAISGGLCSAAELDEGIPLERVQAMLEAARMVERHNGGVTVDLMELIESGGGELNQQLDSYSKLMESDAYRLERSRLTGEFGGLGIVIRTYPSGIFVQQVFAGSPAAKAGVLQRDLILAVDGRQTSGLTTREHLAALRGEIGSKVSLVIRRAAMQSIIEVKRGLVEIPSVHQGRLLQDGAALLRIAQFHLHTRKQLVAELNRLRNLGMKALVLDLRGNGGGSVEGAVDAVSLFLKSGALITTAKTSGERDRQYEASSRGSRFRELPLVLLVDGGTASAAELAAASLQDHGRAELIGRPTFGKGIGQRTVRLGDGFALKLTTTEYLTPKGRRIQKEGVQPDHRLQQRSASAEASDPAVGKALQLLNKH